MVKRVNVEFQVRDAVVVVKVLGGPLHILHHHVFVYIRASFKHEPLITRDTCGFVVTHCPS